MLLIGKDSITASLTFGIDAMVDAAWLAVKTGMEQTRDVLVLSKEVNNAVQEVVGESTTKIGVGEVKTSVPVGTLTIHSVEEGGRGRELIDITGSDSVTEGICSSVDEVLITSMV